MTPQAATAMQPVKTSNITSQTATQQDFDRIQQIYDSIARRAFEIFAGSGRSSGHELTDWLLAESELLHPVHLEIAESDDALNVKAEVPGFAANEIDVRVDGNRLTISGKHESQDESAKGKTIYSERCAKEVFRSVELPADVDGSKVSATLKDGILNIELPKPPHAKSVRIEPKAAD
ncbi:MAG TPA: Hsp20/alpha crystallin family protein [Bryobacteraceae bacterium]|nr:Hsp20/alpha crystallin family protein [Bryobacteraceae bacterium]